MTRALVVAAHPDDEVLGCGGTIARLTRERAGVSVAILGEGATSRASSRRRAAPSQVRVLRQQSRLAAKELGVSDVSWFGLPDNRFDSVDLLEIVKVVEGLIRRVQPTVVYTHHPGDLNIDHRLTFQAVLTATRPLADCTVRALYSFEVPSSTEWAFGKVTPPFSPNVFVDISSTLGQKIRALKRYAGEVRPFPHPRSPKVLEAAATRWGSAIGVESAEAFELIRERV